VLCYPKYSASELIKRLRELRSLGVNVIEFAGDKSVFNTLILGKGHTGVVVIAHRYGERFALKIRRIDSGKVEMKREAEMLKKANDVGVGPRLVDSTENLILMELLEGVLLPQWLESLKNKGAESRIRLVLLEVLEQCWRLDEAAIDHGELSRAPKHIIVDQKGSPHIVDFENSSLSRRSSNVTSVCSYLFLASHAASEIREMLGEIHMDALIKILRDYKRERTREKFGAILRVCRLSQSEQRNVVEQAKSRFAFKGLSDH
jgi:putative serine/threonine protein kinase